MSMRQRGGREVQYSDCSYLYSILRDTFTVWWLLRKVDESRQEISTCKKYDTSLPFRQRFLLYVKAADSTDVTQKFVRIVYYIKSNTVNKMLQSTTKRS